MAFVFLGYWFLCVDQGYQKGKKFRILGTAALCERLYHILRITLLGPGREEMKEWGLSKSRVDTLLKMSEGLALKRGEKVLAVEELFEFIHLPEEDDSLFVPIFSDSKDFMIKRLGDNRYKILSQGETGELD